MKTQLACAVVLPVASHCFYSMPDQRSLMNFAILVIVAVVTAVYILWQKTAGVSRRMNASP